MLHPVLGFRPLAGNNVLIVAHASSLEACTRQLQGRSPLSPKDFIQIVRKVRPPPRVRPCPSGSSVAG